MAGSTPAEAAAPGFAEPLGDGLVRRWSTPADAERFGQLLGTVYRDPERDPLPNPRPVHEASLVMSPRFPSMTPGDLALVEDTSRPDRPMVASACYWRHRWSYAGIRFDVARPEMVATLPEYRRRGLVRALFDMIHARAAAEGAPVTVITGIAYFYRQFGYEYVLDLEGGWSTYLSLVPEPAEGEAEACAIRPATVADVPAIAAIYDAGRADSLVWHETDERHWRYSIELWDDPTVRGVDVTRLGVGERVYTIRDRGDAVRGFVSLPVRRDGTTLTVSELAFAPETAIAALAPSLLRVLRAYAERLPTTHGGGAPVREIRLEIGADHPLFAVLGDALAPRVHRPYAWYVRIPDVPGFLRLVTPALEERLARSPLRGHTGDLRVDLYRTGMRLSFDGGRLAALEPWLPPEPDHDDIDLGCPPLVFLQLLLGYRSVDELDATYPDVVVADRTRLLAATLFPRMRSVVWPLG